MNNSILAQSERVILRYFDKGRDEKIFFNYRNDPEISKYQGWSLPFTTENLKQFFEQMKDIDLCSTDQWLQIACELKETGELIGDCAFNNTDGTVEIGITIRKQFQQKGFAKEILQALFELLFRKIRARKIIAKLDVDNISSIKLMESIGMRQEALLTKSYWDENMREYRDEYYYTISNEEFGLNSS